MQQYSQFSSQLHKGRGLPMAQTAALCLFLIQPGNQPVPSSECQDLHQLLKGNMGLKWNINVCC